MKNRILIRRISRAAVIGALYVILTLISNALGLAYKDIQCRFSEALCILPLFCPEAVTGLTIGCLLANLMISGLWQDIIFGTLATLLGALGALALRRLRGRARVIATLPTVLSNAIIIPFVLKWALDMEKAWWIYAVSVAAGELVSATLLGTLLLPVVDRLPIFKKDDKF